ncbi:SLC35A1 [Branchiostoma lanceolatum]|uniref:SLC35A1 protein n=1 Tax=Branchiostoma lanceolatum TaxID=7740 RepID=A0A8K0AF62_BRALA|nr:SLC35A1 [Branchiostoma lanceolatum]
MSDSTKNAAANTDNGSGEAGKASDGTAKKEGASVVFKLYCLAVLTVMAASYTVLMRYTRTVEGVRYYSTTTVFVTECAKMFFTLCILLKEHKGSIRKVSQELKGNIVGKPMEMLKMSVPSIVYAIQNNMTFIGLSNLDAATYQVTYQMKIPCTALLSVMMLGRSLSSMQWIAVFVLTGGVILVQGIGGEAVSHTTGTEGNYVVGLTALTIAVFCSGFAGVYFEKLLKGSDTSLWVRNVQMYSWGMLSAFLGVVMHDYQNVRENGFLYGYTPLVWLVVLLGSGGGIYTSIVVKYTDNIMKGFAAAAAIVLSTIASIMFMGLVVGWMFVMGASLVIAAIFLYGLPKTNTEKLPVRKSGTAQNV